MRFYRIGASSVYKYVDSEHKEYPGQTKPLAPEKWFLKNKSHPKVAFLTTKLTKKLIKQLYGF